MATTNRDWADKRWLKAPREEVPFPVRLMDIGFAIVVALIVLLAVIAVLALSTPETKASAPASSGADWKVFLPLFFRNRDPINPPRCPRENARGELIEYGIAMQADGNEWVIDCRYAPAAVRS